MPYCGLEAGILAQQFDNVRRIGAALQLLEHQRLILMRSAIGRGLAGATPFPGTTRPAGPSENRRRLPVQVDEAITTRRSNGRSPALTTLPVPGIGKRRIMQSDTQFFAYGRFVSDCTAGIEKDSKG